MKKSLESRSELRDPQVPPIQAQQRREALRRTDGTLPPEAPLL